MLSRAVILHVSVVALGSKIMKITDLLENKQLQEGPVWDELKGRMGAGADAFMKGTQSQQDDRKLKNAQKIYVDTLLRDLGQAVKSGYVVFTPPTPSNTPAQAKAKEEPAQSEPAKAAQPGKPDYSKPMGAYGKQTSNVPGGVPKVPQVPKLSAKQAQPKRQPAMAESIAQSLLSMTEAAPTGISVAQWIRDYVMKTFSKLKMRDGDPAINQLKALSKEFQNEYNPGAPQLAKKVAEKLFGLVHGTAQTRQKADPYGMGSTRMSGAAKPSSGADQTKSSQEAKVKVVNQEPIVLDWDKKLYGLDDRGQWIHLRSGEVQQQAIQSFLSQQHDKSLGINK